MNTMSPRMIIALFRFATNSSGMAKMPQLRAFLCPEQPSG
jgi:hypothetical protein